MKHYKKMMLLIYGALLLICIGIVWLLGALNRQGNTIIQITHDSNVAKAGSRILTLKDGVLL